MRHFARGLNFDDDLLAGIYTVHDNSLQLRCRSIFFNILPQKVFLKKYVSLASFFFQYSLRQNRLLSHVDIFIPVFVKSHKDKNSNATSGKILPKCWKNWERKNKQDLPSHLLYLISSKGFMWVFPDILYYEKYWEY